MNSQYTVHKHNICTIWYIHYDKILYKIGMTKYSQHILVILSFLGHINWNKLQIYIILVRYQFFFTNDVLVCILPLYVLTTVNVILLTIFPGLYPEWLAVISRFLLRRIILNLFYDISFLTSIQDTLVTNVCCPKIGCKALIEDCFTRDKGNESTRHGCFIFHFHKSCREDALVLYLIKQPIHTALCKHLLWHGQELTEVPCNSARERSPD